MEALPHDIVAGVVDHKVAAVEEGYFCVLARRCSALPHRGTIGICKYQVAFVVQRYPGADFVHGRVATLRGVGVCRPDDGCICGACGVPDGEDESIYAELVEAAREGAVRGDEEDLVVVLSSDVRAGGHGLPWRCTRANLEEEQWKEKIEQRSHSSSQGAFLAVEA